MHTGRSNWNDDPRSRSGWNRLGDGLSAWIRTRTAEHWLMFAIGLAIGALL